MNRWVPLLGTVLLLAAMIVAGAAEAQSPTPVPNASPKPKATHTPYFPQFLSTSVPASRST